MRIYGELKSFKSLNCFLKTLENQIKEPSNTLKGSGNTTQKGTRDTLVSGRSNTLEGNNENCFISGNNNKIDNSINNANVFGSYGRATSQGALTLGCGGGSLGYSQTSFIQQYGRTTNGSATIITTQGEEEKWIAYQNNSVIGFKAQVVVVCYGGGDGTAGDYAYLELKGAVKIDNGGNTTFSQSSTTIASSGNTGTAVLDDSGTDGYISVKVTGAANRNLEWFASVQIIENRLQTVTF